MLRQSRLKTASEPFEPWNSRPPADLGWLVAAPVGTEAQSANMEAVRTSNIELINAADTGYDVVIVCTGNVKQAEYWQQRLETVRGVVVPVGTTIVAVDEDWKGGAGNGLGTLYAYVKACAVAKEKHGIDISASLAAGTHSVSLYHTAGKGTRLAPLPAAENNNKPGVNLPVAIPVGDQQAPLSILEAVIKQTGAYAASRKGRLSVYWGDQVFIPSVEMTYVPSCHADILCTLGPMASEEEWTAKGLSGYGLIAVGATGAAQVEKVTHAEATKMLSSLGEITNVGVSLGSFSLSSALLEAFCDEFKTELAAKEGKLDTDPHWWMPLTLQCDDYCGLMEGKGVPVETSKAHHDRMSAFLARFAPEGAMPSGMGLFGAVDIGEDAFWWDYGQLRWYMKYNLMLAATDEDADAVGMRQFFGVCEGRVSPDSWIGDGCTVDGGSCVSASQVAAGSVSGSVLSNVVSGSVECDGCVVVGVSVKSLKLGKGCVVYNVVDDSMDLSLNDGEVIVGVVDDDGNQTLIRSASSIDGGQAWKERVCGNPASFEELHAQNAEADIVKIEGLRRTKSGAANAAIAAASPR